MVGPAPMTEEGGLLPGIIVTPSTHIMNTEIDLGLVTLDPEPVTTAIGAAATMTHVGLNPDHSTGLLTTTFHIIEAPALTTTMIHLTADITGMSPEITADLMKDPENTTTNQPKALHHLHTLHHGSLRTGNIDRSQLTIHCQITAVQMIQIATLMMI